MLRNIVAVLTVATAMTAGVQVPTTFETASVTRNTSGANAASFQIFPGGQFRDTNATVRELVQAAFDFTYERFQIVGGPAWINSERYDVQATPGGQADPNRVATPQEIAVRIQALLAERFQLVMRRETRDMAHFDLIVERPGVLKPADTSACAPPAAQRTPGETRPRCGLSYPPDTGDVQHVKGTGATVAALARRLQQPIEAIIRPDRPLGYLRFHARLPATERGQVAGRQRRRVSVHRRSGAAGSPPAAGTRSRGRRRHRSDRASLRELTGTRARATPTCASANLTHLPAS